MDKKIKASIYKYLQEANLQNTAQCLKQESKQVFDNIIILYCRKHDSYEVNLIYLYLYTFK